MNPNPAMDEAVAALFAQARRSVSRHVKIGARRYALRPALMDAITPGLSDLNHNRLIERIYELRRRDADTGHRWTGFGGEIRSINIKSAAVYARYQRLVHHIKTRALEKV